MHRLLRLFVAVGVVTGVASAVPRGVLTVEKSAANAVLLRAPPRPAEEAAGRRLEDPSAQHDVEPLGAAGRPTRQEHAAPLAHGGGSWRRMAEDDSDHLHMGPLNEQLQRYLHTDVEQWVVGKASQVVNLDGHRGRSLQSAASSGGGSCVNQCDVADHGPDGAADCPPGCEFEATTPYQALPEGFLNVSATGNYNCAHVDCSAAGTCTQVRAFDCEAVVVDCPDGVCDASMCTDAGVDDAWSVVRYRTCDWMVNSSWIDGEVILDGGAATADAVASAAAAAAALEEDGPWEPIRIHINTSSMYSDPTGRACYRWPHKRSHLIHHLARTDSRGLSVWVPG